MRAVKHRKPLDPLAAEICRLFDVQPWDVGLVPAPWRVRVRAWLTLRRWRARRRMAKLEAFGSPTALPNRRC